MIYDDTDVRKKKRQYICDSSLSLFLKKGLLETTIKDITKQAKIERKTFYYYFVDKLELASYLYYLSLETLYHDLPDNIETYKDYVMVMIERIYEHKDQMIYMVLFEYMYGDYKDQIKEVVFEELGLDDVRSMFEIKDELIIQTVESVLKDTIYNYYLNQSNMQLSLDYIIDLLDKLL